MSKDEELKIQIAKVLGVNSSDITDDYSLKTGKFKTSAGSVILGNIVNKIYGKKVDCRKVTTFGNLIDKIEGRESDALVEAPSSAKEAKSSNRSFATSRPSGRLICGIDIQEINIFPVVNDYWKESFYTDNFTDAEIAYCSTADSPVHSFAGRWCVKEALHKCGAEYYDIPLHDIQVLNKVDGVLSIELRTSDNTWEELSFACSISHSDNYAVGMVTGF